MIYYHLKKSQRWGYVSSEIEKKGRRPDRFVYTITDDGKAYFRELLTKALNERFETEFNLDAALFFFERFSPEQLQAAFKEHEAYLSSAVKYIKQHRQHVLDLCRRRSRQLLRRYSTIIWLILKLNWNVSGLL